MEFENAEGARTKESGQSNGGLELSVIAQGSDLKQVLKSMSGSAGVDLPALQMEEKGAKGGCPVDSKCLTLPGEGKIPSQDGGEKPWFKDRDAQLKPGKEHDETAQEQEEEDPYLEEEEPAFDDECTLNGKTPDVNAKDHQSLAKKSPDKWEKNDPSFEKEKFNPFDKYDKYSKFDASGKKGMHIEKMPAETIPDRDLKPESGRKKTEVDPAEKKRIWLKELELKTSKN